MGKLILGQFLTACMAFMIVLFGPADAQAQTATHQSVKSVALIIGNGAYSRAGRLANPVADATAVDTALRELGFQTTLVRDMSSLDLKQKLNAFYAELSDAEVILFYFAGHGMQIAGENFLVPVDFGTRDDVPLKRQLLPVNTILAAIEARARPHASKVVILDACRDNPFDKLLKATGEKSGRGLARMNLPQASGPVSETAQGYFRILAFATAPNMTAADGEGAHSPYTRSLVKHIRQPGIEVKDMFVRIANDVQRETQGHQRPDFLVQTSRALYFSVPNITTCDKLAIENQNFLGIPGIPFDDINPAKAVPSCEAAVAKLPDSARLNNNLARAYEKNGRLKEAYAYYKRSADAGYPPAINALGIMYLAGCGLPEADVETGVRTIVRARELGNLSAHATLTSHDLLPHISRPDETRLRARLKVGRTADLRVALKSFQQKRHLRIAGLSLETIHALGLYEIVPEGFRCH